MIAQLTFYLLYLTTKFSTAQGKSFDLKALRELDTGCMGWTLPGYKPWGMVSDKELCVLHNIALETSGPILEQGSFVGLSTTAIALALKKRYEVNKEVLLFVTNDIFPAGFIDIDRKKYVGREIPYYWKTSNRDRMVVEEYTDQGYELSVGKGAWRKTFKKFLDLPGGQLHALYASLHKNKLLPYVTITAGRQYPILPYSFVWSDAAHSPEEIALNAPKWIEICETEAREVIYLFHDVRKTEEKQSVRKIFQDRGFEILDSLAIAQTRMYAMQISCRATS